MWPFFLSRTVSTSKVIHVPVDEALRALHDSPTIIKLNPLVVDVIQDSADPNMYNIIDLIPVLGQTKYAVKFHFVDDGFDSQVKAGLGTSLNNTWRARAVEGGTEVTEVVAIEAFFLMMPFVAGNLKQSHEQLLDQLATNLQASDSSATSGELNGTEY